MLSSLQRLPQLRTYLNSALNTGIDPGEVRETLIQCAPFAGFPATVNALELFREVLDGRQASVDETDVVEVELAELDSRGAELQALLFGDTLPFGHTSADRAADGTVHEAGQVAQTLARIERQFVFGELFHRPGLDLQARAVCALASVVALRMPEEQRGWAAGCLRVGIEPAALAEIALQSAYYAGFPSAKHALQIVNEVIAAPKV
jgi:4-carboxymuconolactone decarboxylase